ncbi:MAG TPA: hypothetical protein VH583_05275 [Vicinamibacterales bacterium]|jgi:hypothetical protein
MVNLKFVGSAVGAVVVAAGLVASVSANTANRTAYLTFSGAVALPGVELSAGTYVFELVAPESSPSIVRVMSRDRKKVFLTAFTHYVDRPAGNDHNKPITFAEAPKGQAPPIKAWYPTDESMGREFVYGR